MAFSLAERTRRKFPHVTAAWLCWGSNAPSATVPSSRTSILWRKARVLQGGPCHQCLPGRPHRSSVEEGGSQDGFMEEVMFGLGIDIYQEDKCLWHKGHSTGTSW